MNEVNPLEERLQSWTLRQPSERIKNTLFRFRKPVETPLRGVSRRRNGGFVPGILPLAAPAMACFMAVLAVIGPENLRPSARRSMPLFASVSSNIVEASVSTDDFLLTKARKTIGRNDWSQATFEWTNWNVSSSSNGSLPLARTNWCR